MIYTHFQFNMAAFKQPRGLHCANMRVTVIARAALRCTVVKRAHNKAIKKLFNVAGEHHAREFNHNQIQRAAAHNTAQRRSA